MSAAGAVCLWRHEFVFVIGGDEMDERAVLGFPGDDVRRVVVAAFEASDLMSRRRPDFCFFSPWHSRQCFWKIGRTSRTKSTGAARAEVVSKKAEEPHES
jgi:hypothetical protein